MRLVWCDHRKRKEVGEIEGHEVRLVWYEGVPGTIASEYLTGSHTSLLCKFLRDYCLHYMWR